MQGMETQSLRKVFGWCVTQGYAFTSWRTFNKDWTSDRHPRGYARPTVRSVNGPNTLNQERVNLRILNDFQP